MNRLRRRIKCRCAIKWVTSVERKGRQKQNRGEKGAGPEVTYADPVLRNTVLRSVRMNCS